MSKINRQKLNPLVPAGLRRHQMLDLQSFRAPDLRHAPPYPRQIRPAHPSTQFRRITLLGKNVMPLPKDKAWFSPKTYGWGWGLPSRWQGWIVMLVFCVALIAGAPLVKKGPLVYVAYSFALAGVLVAIAYWKGEKPHWSWGKRE